MTAPGPLPALSRAAVDRAAVHRTDQAWLDEAWDRAAVLVLDERGNAQVDGDPPRLLLASAGDAPDGDRLFLGEQDDVPYFAVLAGNGTAGGRGDPADGARIAAGSRRMVGLREAGADLDDRDAGLLVAAVALANWHARHGHCPRCGAPTRSERAGWVRVCERDGSDHFPRVDPAMIVLVHDGADRCLLGRQPMWPAGRYSTLAGFVEPGESAEAAVVREVAEETAVKVYDIRYVASQPWPFPSSLMLGFTARADYAGGRSIDVDGDEIEDARWFTREEVQREAASRNLLLPTSVSIAHRLITGWVAGELP